LAAMRGWSPASRRLSESFCRSFLPLEFYRCRALPWSRFLNGCTRLASSRYGSEIGRSAGPHAIFLVCFTLLVNLVFLKKRRANLVRWQEEKKSYVNDEKDSEIREGSSWWLQGVLHGVLVWFMKVYAIVIGVSWGRSYVLVSLYAGVNCVA
jgi:hypothetical protein